MSSIFTAIIGFWTTYGPWIGAALIPTIITGLSLSPKTALEATWVQKIWNVVKQVMGFLSLATPKDTVGTFQLPLKLGKVLNKKNVPPAGGAALLLIFVFTNSGCTWFKSEVKTAETIGLNCLEQGIKDKYMDLVPVVIAATTGGALTQVIEAFGKEFGEDVVACAAKDAKTQLLAQLPAGGAIANDPTTAKVNKLNMVIKAKKWTYSEGSK